MAAIEFKIDRTKRMLARLDRFAAGSPEMGAALFEIGNLIKNAAVRNLKQSGAWDSGILGGHVSFRVEKSEGLASVVVGPFGIKYARMVEFGGMLSKRQMIAMLAGFRETGKPYRNKGIISGKGLTGRYYKPRPYMGPALRDSQASIIETLRGLLKD